MLKTLTVYWKQLNREEQIKYQKLADQDKKRYNEQVHQLEKDGYFITEDGQQSNHVIPLDYQRSFLPHVVRPKKCLGANQIFLMAKMKEICAENSDKTNKEIYSIIGKKWSELLDDQK